MCQDCYLTEKGLQRQASPCQQFNLRCKINDSKLTDRSAVIGLAVDSLVLGDIRHPAYLGEERDPLGA